MFKHIRFIVVYKKNSLLSDPPKGTKPNYIVYDFFSSEPRKQTLPIISISTDIHLDKVRKRS